MCGGMMEPIRIFVGYDPKEPVAYHVCCESIIRQASQPVSLTPLALGPLAQHYDNRWHKDGSNDFIYSRFLVPWLCDFEGAAIFIDGDMLLRTDIAELWQQRSSDFGVQVVKHHYRTKHPIKYLGYENKDYPCKNWSSVIIWNCAHEAHRCLTPAFVGKVAGPYLHRFEWLREDKIGELSPDWNHLAMEWENSQAKLVHYTIGIPAFKEYAFQEHAGEWFMTLNSMLQPLTHKF